MLSMQSEEVLGMSVPCESNPDIFFPEDVEGEPQRYARPIYAQEKTAKTMCFQCPVRIACLKSALEFDGTVGIWGGTTESERNYMRRMKQNPETYKMKIPRKNRQEPETKEQEI